MKRVLAALFTVLVGLTPVSLAADGLADETTVMITDSNISAFVGFGTVLNGEMTLELSVGVPGSKVSLLFVSPQGEVITLSGVVQNDGTLKVEDDGREVELATWLESRNVGLAQSLASGLAPEENDDAQLERVPEAELPLATPATPDIGGESGVESALPPVSTGPPTPPQAQPGTQTGVDDPGAVTQPGAALPATGDAVPVPATGDPSPDSAAGADPALNDGGAPGGSAGGSGGQAVDSGTAPGAPTAEPDEGAPASPQDDGSQDGGSQDDGSQDTGTGSQDDGSQDTGTGSQDDGSQDTGTGSQDDGSQDTGSQGSGATDSPENAPETPAASPDEGNPGGANDEGGGSAPAEPDTGPGDPGSSGSPGSPEDQGEPDDTNGNDDVNASPADDGTAGDADSDGSAASPPEADNSSDSGAANGEGAANDDGADSGADSSGDNENTDTHDGAPDDTGGASTSENSP